MAFGCAARPMHSCHDVAVDWETFETDRIMTAWSGMNILIVKGYKLSMIYGCSGEKQVKTSASVILGMGPFMSPYSNQLGHL